MIKLTKTETNYQNSPLRLLLVTLTTVSYWLRSKLYEAVVEFTMRPIVLGVRGITKSKRGKLHLLQTSWSQSCTSKCSPELLTIWWQFTLPSSRDCNEHDIVLQ